MFAIKEIPLDNPILMEHHERDPSKAQQILENEVQRWSRVSLFFSFFWRDAMRTCLTVRLVATIQVKIIEGKLRHPNVVRYYSSFAVESSLYIVMEMIEGASLQDHFNALLERKGHLEEDRIWHIFVQVCRKREGGGAKRIALRGGGACAAAACGAQAARPGPGCIGDCDSHKFICSPCTDCQRSALHPC